MQLTRFLGQGGARSLSACRAHSDHRNTRTHTGRPIGRTQERLFKEHAFQIPSDRYKKSPLILTTHGEVRLQLDRGASLSHFGPRPPMENDCGLAQGTSDCC